MQIEVIETQKLIPYALNSRTHSDKQVAQIASSIKEFGFTNPVLIDKDNGIIAGHGRVMAAEKLGLTEVPCIRLEHLTEAQRKAYIIADNKLALGSGWNEEMLKVEIQALREMDFNLDLTGFDAGEIANLELEKIEGVTDAEKEWEGMPEYEGLPPCFRKVVVNFDTPDDVEEFFSIIGQGYTDKTKSIWFPEKEKRDLESVRWAEDNE